MVIEIGMILGGVGALVTGLCLIIGWLLKRWMDSLDEKFNVLFKKVDKIEDKFDNNFRNTQAYRENLAHDIKSMSVQMTVANGRTGKLEKNIELVEASIALEVGRVKGRLDTQMKLCEERNKTNGHQPFGFPERRTT
jgi:cation transport regulator ChaB